MIDVDGVPLGGSGGDLRGLHSRRRIDAYPLRDDGLVSWGEAEEASVRAPLGDIRVHQVEQVSCIGVELLARDGLSPFLVVVVAAEAGAYVLPLEVLCGVGRSGRTPWPRCPGLLARW